jgi:transposase InsO family protein
VALWEDNFRVYGVSKLWKAARLHSSLGYLSPVDYENRYRQTVTSTLEVA